MYLACLTGNTAFFFFGSASVYAFLEHTEDHFSVIHPSLPFQDQPLMTANEKGSGFNSVMYLTDSHFEALESPTKSNLILAFDLTLEKATYIPLYLKSQDVRFRFEIASIT